MLLATSATSTCKKRANVDAAALHESTLVRGVRRFIHKASHSGCGYGPLFAVSNLFGILAKVNTRLLTRWTTYASVSIAALNSAAKIFLNFISGHRGGLLWNVLLTKP